jgi:PadR family transcriptional regulator PadR
VLKKDLMELCLLRLLAERDAYGYEFLHRIHQAFPGTQESAIYALLRQLCREGYTRQYEGDASGGPTRKYYRITEAGREELARLLAEWSRLRDALDALGVE